MTKLTFTQKLLIGYKLSTPEAVEDYYFETKRYRDRGDDLLNYSSSALASFYISDEWIDMDNQEKITIWEECLTLKEIHDKDIEERRVRQEELRTAMRIAEAEQEEQRVKQDKIDAQLEFENRYDMDAIVQQAIQGTDHSDEFLADKTQKTHDN